jgi:hypothetical protein
MAEVVAHRATPEVASGQLLQWFQRISESHWIVYLALASKMVQGRKRHFHWPVRSPLVRAATSRPVEKILERANRPAVQGLGVEGATAEAFANQGIKALFLLTQPGSVWCWNGPLSSL